jgi:hypothetical protein
MQMSLQQWENNGWLKSEPPSSNEINNLLFIIDRDIKDSQEKVSADWQFGIAYNAALKLCTVLLRSEGYRPSHGNHHYRTIMSVPEILGSEWNEKAEYLNACRMKRNTLEYDYAGVVTTSDIKELLVFIQGFKETVQGWLNNNHPEFL